MLIVMPRESKAGALHSNATQWGLWCCSAQSASLSIQSKLDTGASPEAAAASSAADATPLDRPPAVLTALADQEAGWVQNVGKSGRTRAALSAKSSESVSREAAPLASEARQAAEEQAAGPHVQATVEAWTHKASILSLCGSSPPAKCLGYWDC